MTFQQASQAQQIAAALPGRATDGCALIALDGRAGAGKSTLAAVLAEQLGGLGRATIVNGDDFFVPRPVPQRLSMDTVEAYHRYFAWQELRDEILAPLAHGNAARYAPYQPGADATLRGEPRHLPAKGVVVVEGVLTARPELAPFCDLTVLVDTPSEVCLHRLYARGGGPERDAWITRWRIVEEHYRTATRLHARTGLIVRGE
ncbi:hypothetical protein ABTY53_32825 [Streptomyces noursei]|uniref:uridine kinase family protein n=1 Tax=Streptomyces noursei TaxID=1971 RepID=UPI00331C014E